MNKLWETFWTIVCAGEKMILESILNWFHNYLNDIQIHIFMNQQILLLLFGETKTFDSLTMCYLLAIGLFYI